MSKKLPAFTLIELLLSISIMALLFGIGAAKYVSFNQGQILKQTAQKLKSDLRVAANKAITGEKPTGVTCTNLDGYEFSFTSSSYSYRARCNNGSIVYGTAVSPPSFSSGVSLAPTGTILFKVLGQGVDPSITVTLSGFGKPPEIITVNTSGEIQ